MKKLFILLFVGIASNFGFSQTMYAHYIDIGQGAATLLEFPCGAILIDAGAQDEEHEEKLVEYLTAFFEKRKDLNNTLDLVAITHCHKDHNVALDDVMENFTVKNYVDNSLKIGSGKDNQVWLQETHDEYETKYRGYTFDKISNDGNKKGINDEIIDPVACSETDPKITILSGAFKRKPAGWSEKEIKNGNNHSLVIKVEYGEASFLFTGDLEEDGIDKLVKFYEGTKMLDCDVWLVGHHGSHNATTEELLDAITPDYAVISCGKSTYGTKPGDNKVFNTYKFGHPRIDVINMLEAQIEGKRSTPKVGKAAEKATVFKQITIKKKVYSTSWDNNIIMTAKADGTFIVNTNK